MRKGILFSLLFLTITANAQLRVSSDGNVGIRTLPSTNSILAVGSNNVGNASVGITCSPMVKNMDNIGVKGAVEANSSNTSDTNYGVLGIVSPINYAHGRNYGVSGMIGYPYVGSFYGGAGVYGTNSTYYYSNPINIQGTYAGYFAGPVYVSNNLTAPNLFTTSDIRLSEDLVSLVERDNSGKATLENILNMNVVEYNLKGRQYEEISENVDPEKAEELRKELEYLKKEDKEMTSRRHFGVNAEELQKLYPDLVLEGQDGYLSVNYSELVPLLIRSIQVLKQELDDVKSKSKAQRRAQTTGINASSASGNILYQNAPNPFKEQTIIRFKLAEGVQDASVCIFDMTGKTLKKLPISSGMESVSVGSYELGEGMFLYSLIVNGQEIDTKKMVIQ